MDSISLGNRQAVSRQRSCHCVEVRGISRTVPVSEQQHGTGTCKCTVRAIGGGKVVSHECF